ncbi:MAG: hypothetical protein ACI8W9_001848, partial [Psychromonas sp.]
KKSITSQLINKYPYLLAKIVSAAFFKVEPQQSFLGTVYVL